jgi:Outer membrane protein beta-barrel domain
MRLLRGAVGLIVAAQLVWPEHARAQNGVGFRFVFGRQAMTGDLGAELDPSTDSEFAILIPAWVLRVGAGASYASFRQSGTDSSWSQIGLQVLVTYPFRLTPKLRPYLEARYTYRRLRPEEDRYFGGEEQVLGDYVSSGSGLEGALGVEFVLHPRAAIDFSATAGRFALSPNLSDAGLGDIDSGGTWSIHFGMTWFPLSNR